MCNLNDPCVSDKQTHFQYHLRTNLHVLACSMSDIWAIFISCTLMKVRSEIEMSSATWYWLQTFLTYIFLLIYFIWLWKIARKHPQCCSINWTGFVIFIFPKGRGSPFGNFPVLFPWFPSKLLTLRWYQDVQMPFFLSWICLVRLLAPQCWYVYELQNSPDFYGLHGIVVLDLINHTSPHLVFLLSRVLHNSGDQEWWLSRIWKRCWQDHLEPEPHRWFPNCPNRLMENKLSREYPVLTEMRCHRNVPLDCPSHSTDIGWEYTVGALTRIETAQNQKVRDVAPTWCSETSSEYWPWPISITIAIIRDLLSTDHVLMQTFSRQQRSTCCSKAESCLSVLLKARGDDSGALPRC